MRSPLELLEYSIRAKVAQPGATGYHRPWRVGRHSGC